MFSSRVNKYDIKRNDPFLTQLFKFNFVSLIYIMYIANYCDESLYHQILLPFIFKAHVTPLTLAGKFQFRCKQSGALWVVTCCSGINKTTRGSVVIH